MTAPNYYLYRQYLQDNGEATIPQYLRITTPGEDLNWGGRSTARVLTQDNAIALRDALDGLKLEKSRFGIVKVEPSFVVYNNDKHQYLALVDSSISRALWTGERDNAKSFESMEKAAACASALNLLFNAYVSVEEVNS